MPQVEPALCVLLVGGAGLGLRDVLHTVLKAGVSANVRGRSANAIVRRWRPLFAPWLRMNVVVFFLKFLFWLILFLLVCIVSFLRVFSAWTFWTERKVHGEGTTH